MRKTILGATVAAVGVAAFGAQPSTEGSTAQSPAAEPQICKMVTDERAAKPFQMCLTKAEWALKEIADAKDPNRMVCHYEEEPGTRLRGRKVCMTAVEWAAQRQGDREVTERIQSQTCVQGAGC